MLDKNSRFRSRVVELVALRRKKIKWLDIKWTRRQEESKFYVEVKSSRMDVA